MAENTYTAAVITVSDKGFRGEREDTSGPALCAIAEQYGLEWGIPCLREYRRFQDSLADEHYASG